MNAFSKELNISRNMMAFLKYTINIYKKYSKSITETHNEQVFKHDEIFIKTPQTFFKYK